ncbi:MAG: serine--tRNA ligase [Alphaproteobacteria bacterium]|nr:serine--tRNA ligase [Alphaproteobacteria bacterium]
MHDLKAIRDNPDQFDAALKRRGMPPSAAAIIELDAERRRLQTEFQAVQARRNEASKLIGQAKAKKEDATALMAEVATLKDRTQALETEERAVGEALDKNLSEFPNLPASDVPDGLDEKHNVELRRVGEPRKFSFAPKQHFELGENLKLMDFERAAKLSGARFVVLSGALARLERALAAYMLDLHTKEFGYTEVSPPMLVRESALYGTGQLPKFGGDLFKTEIFDPIDLGRRVQKRAWPLFVEKFKLWSEEGTKKNISALQLQHQKEFEDNIVNQFEQEIKETGLFEQRWLIPTAEVPLTNLVADEILDEATLPKRLTALTACFRAEAGAAGRDTRGMIRQHQFAKVELVSIAHPDQSNDEHERMTACAEAVLKGLELPFRTMVLCAGDMGFSARKTYDIEVWLPGQSAYREISSCSNCGDFQARRMKARFRRKGEKGTQFVHTLNGSGLAVGRTLIAVLENYQEEDGSVTIPTALRPFMDGMTRIEAAKR